MQQNKISRTVLVSTKKDPAELVKIFLKSAQSKRSDNDITTSIEYYKSIQNGTANFDIQQKQNIYELGIYYFFKALNSNEEMEIKKYSDIATTFLVYINPNADLCKILCSILQILNSEEKSPLYNTNNTTDTQTYYTSLLFFLTTIKKAKIQFVCGVMYLTLLQNLLGNKTLDEYLAEPISNNLDNTNTRNKILDYLDLSIKYLIISSNYENNGYNPATQLLQELFTQNSSAYLSKCQHNLLLHIGTYLHKTASTTENFNISEYSNEGHCAGLTALWLYCRFLQNQPSNTPNQRDDYNWFQKEMTNILLLQEPAIPTQPIPEIDHFILLMEQFHKPNSIFRGNSQKKILQGNLDLLLQDTNKITFQNRHEIIIPADNKLLSFILMKLDENELVYMGLNSNIDTVQGHAISFIKQNGLLYYYDSNCNIGQIIQPDNNLGYEFITNKILHYITNANTNYSEKYQAITLQTFVDSKNNLTQTTTKDLYALVFKKNNNFITNLITCYDDIFFTITKFSMQNVLIFLNFVLSNNITPKENILKTIINNNRSMLDPKAVDIYMPILTQLFPITEKVTEDFIICICLLAAQTDFYFNLTAGNLYKSCCRKTNENITKNIFSIGILSNMTNEQIYKYWTISMLIMFLLENKNDWNNIQHLINEIKYCNEIYEVNTVINNNIKKPEDKLTNFIEKNFSINNYQLDNEQHTLNTQNKSFNYLDNNNNNNNKDNNYGMTALEKTLLESIKNIIKNNHPDVSQKERFINDDHVLFIKNNDKEYMIPCGEIKKSIEDWFFNGCCLYVMSDDKHVNQPKINNNNITYVIEGNNLYTANGQKLDNCPPELIENIKNKVGKTGGPIQLSKKEQYEIMSYTNFSPLTKEQEIESLTNIAQLIEKLSKLISSFDGININSDYYTQFNETIYEYPSGFKQRLLFCIQLIQDYENINKPSTPSI